MVKNLLVLSSYQNSPSATLDSLSRSSMGTSSHSAESRLQAPTYSLPTPVGLRSRTSWTFSPLNVSTWNRKRRNYKLVVAHSSVIAARKVDSLTAEEAHFETLLSCARRVYSDCIGATGGDRLLCVCRERALFHSQRFVSPLRKLRKHRKQAI